MNRLLKNIAKIILAISLTGVVSVSAQSDWIDGTHLFEEEVRAVVSSVKRLSPEELAATHKSVRTEKKIYQLGDVETFWTKNIVENAFEQTPAVLKAIGTHCYIFLEEGKSITAEAIEKVRKSFDENIYPTNTANFGSENKPGIDNDERITLLMFDIKDGYTGSGGFVGGYFYAVDTYPQHQIPEHVKSNEREMFYLDINPSDPASDRYMNTIAHEFQHMIHFNHDPDEYTWVNEACSQIAPYLCGFGHANQVAAFTRNPDNAMTAWSKDQMLANYGQVYLWNYYIYNSYLREDPKSRSKFFRNLVASKKQGVAGYAEALATISKSFTETFDRFCLANFLNDPTLGKGQYAYDKTMGRLKLPVSETVFSLPAQVYGEVFLWSADAIKVDLANAREALEISFTGFRGKMGIDQTNTFTVALVMSNSRARVEAKISFLDFTIDSGKVQGGKMQVKLEEDYDTATIVVIAQADEEVDDRIYVKAKPMTYEIQIKDMGEVQARASAHVDMKATLQSYASIAGHIDLANEASAMIALNQLDAQKNQLVRELAIQLEQGNFSAIENMCQMISAGELAADSVRPLLKSFVASAEFFSANENLPQLRQHIDLLKSF